MPHRARDRPDQKSMPPMPSPGGMPPAPAPAFFFGSSAFMASVVISRAATEDAFWIVARALRTTRVFWDMTALPIAEKRRSQSQERNSLVDREQLCP